MPDDAPTWVHVWFFMRGRRDFRTLPQQAGPDRMSWEEYDRCVQRWMRAGSPKAKIRDLGAVAESPYIDDEEVPF